MRHFDRRGNALLNIQLLFPLIGITALVVDLGALRVAEVELQAAVDSAALAGVSRLDGTQAGVTAAIDEAVRVGSMNTVHGHGVPIVRADVTTGYHHPTSGSFVASTDPMKVDALWVGTRVDSLETFFAGAAFGQQVMAVEKQVVAVEGEDAGAGAVACWLPLAVPDCYFTSTPVAQAQGLQLKLSSSGQDNAGWASLDGHPSANDVKAHLEDLCVDGTAYVGDLVYLNNGVITAAMSTLDSELEASPDDWDTSRWGTLPPKMNSGGSQSTHARYGRIMEGPIMLFESPKTGKCGASTQFNQSKRLTGFAWAVIYDVDDHGGGKNIRVKLDFTHEYDVGLEAGGLDTNVVYTSAGGLIY